MNSPFSPDVATKIKTLLTASKAVISTPEKWTTVVYARDYRGEEVSVCTEGATCFCTLGAIGHTYYTQPSTGIDCTQDVRTLAIGHLSSYMNNMIPEFNDSATHEQVMEAFDKAIAAL